VQGGGVSASSAYTYDAAGRTTSVVRTGPGASNANYSYTSAGRLSGAAWSTGMAVAYDYNQAGQLTGVTPSGTGSVPAVTYGYDPAGLVSTVTREGSTPVTTSAVYDGAGQLTSLEHSTAESVLESYAITRDTRGNPTQVVTTTAAGVTSALYSYDAVSRLRTECYPVTGDVCVAKSPRNAYTYDLVGNRAKETSRTVVGTTATTVVTDYTYDAAYQLLTESVDGTATVTNMWGPNGALATSTTPAGTQVFTTDLTDELISLELADGSTVGYTHDAQGNRTSRTVDGLLDATWAWDDLSSLPMRIGEYEASGTLATAWLVDPTSSTGASLAQTSGGSSSWLLSDPFANTVASVSTTGSTVSGTKTMDAFGVERVSATVSLADASVGFAGQYLDAATGLYDMRARDYDPASGRFTATDPVDVSTGTPYFAGYSYSYNNPLMFNDVSGMQALGVYDYGLDYRPTSPMYAPVVSTSGASFSWTGYQNVTTVSHEILPSSVDCARDLNGKPGVITDICVARQKALNTERLRKQGGCWKALAWYSEHSGAITATVGVGAWSLAPRISEGFSTSKGATRTAPDPAQGFDSFSSAKRSLPPPGKGNVYDHVVEQSQISVTRSGFDTRIVNNPYNMNPVPASVNQARANYYSSVRPFTGGKTVRDWLNGQTFAQQYSFGIDITTRVQSGAKLP